MQERQFYVLMTNMHQAHHAQELPTWYPTCQARRRAVCLQRGAIVWTMVLSERVTHVRWSVVCMLHPDGFVIDIPTDCFGACFGANTWSFLSKTEVQWVRQNLF